MLLGVFMLGAIGLTVACFALRRPLLYIVGVIAWLATGLWVINLVPAPAGNATLPGLTSVLAGMMAFVLLFEFIRNIMAGRVDPDEQVRIAHRRRLDEITADDEWREDGRRRTVEGQSKALPSQHPTYLRGKAVLEAMKREKR